MLDRVKEAIFSIIGPACTDMRVLDLFAGSGALGIEALSRGAKQVVFVEKSRSVAKLVEKNLAVCGFSGQAQTIQLPTLTYLKKFGPTAEPFDLILIDPPFKDEVILDILVLIDRHSMLADGGFIMAESSKRSSMDFSKQFGSFVLCTDRKYGDSRVCIYERTSNE